MFHFLNAIINRNAYEKIVKDRVVKLESHIYTAVFPQWAIACRSFSLRVATHLISFKSFSACEYPYMLGSLSPGFQGLVGKESNFMGEAARFFLYDLHLIIQTTF